LIEEVSKAFGFEKDTLKILGSVCLACITFLAKNVSIKKDRQKQIYKNTVLL